MACIPSELGSKLYGEMVRILFGGCGVAGLRRGGRWDQGYSIILYIHDSYTIYITPTLCDCRSHVYIGHIGLETTSLVSSVL